MCYIFSSKTDKSLINDDSKCYFLDNALVSQPDKQSERFFFNMKKVIYNFN